MCGGTMNNSQAVTITAELARSFLVAQVDQAATEVELLGAGAWSQAFGFRVGGAEFVVRFGRHGDDFAKDRRAHTYVAPDLPVPEVQAIGPAFGG